MDNDFSLWLVLPPLFFALGWASARLDIWYLMREAAELPRQYFDSLKAILAHRTDEATLFLSEVLKRQPDAGELQLALGELYRRQGRFQQAVYLHEQLQHSPRVTQTLRNEASLALARDYLSAGLWDRAESVLLTLKEDSEQGLEAERALVELFEKSAQWDRAIEHRRHWAVKAMRSESKVIAHYRCEQAVQYISRQLWAEAEAVLLSALLENPHSLRAQLLRAESAVQQGLLETVRQSCLEMETYQPDAILLAIPLLQRADEVLGTREATYHYLKSYYERHRIPALLVPLSEWAMTYDDYPQGLVKNIFDALAEYPSPSLLKAFIQLKLALTRRERHEDVNNEDATLVTHVLQVYSRRYEIYRCESCGFVAHRHHWQCPACRAWEPFPIVPELRS
ncbi:MAG: tetratricopeptide repeat protein [Pseudomonadota bacterium]